MFHNVTFKATKIGKSAIPTEGKVEKKQKAAEFQRLFSTPAGGRTLDTLIKSQVLYQLSYGSIVCGCKSTTFFLMLRSFSRFFWIIFITYYKPIIYNKSVFIQLGIVKKANPRTSGRYYSYLKALIGSVREAFKAGKKPAMRPRTAHETKEMTIHSTLTT